MPALLFLLAMPLFAAEPRGVVEGTVFNRLTRVGMPDVAVALRSDGKDVYTTRTDASGAFRMEAVAEGEYFVNLPPVPGHIVLGTGPVRVGERPVKVEVPLAGLGRVSGRVLDPDGRPAPRALVELSGVHDPRGDAVIADAQGRFASDPVLPGAYRLRARAAPSEVETRPDGSRWKLAATYFPGGTDIASAETIVIREGAELNGFEIRLRGAPVYRLRGVVRPAARLTVRLLSQTAWGDVDAQVTSAADGAFEFPAVRAGDWQIDAAAPIDGIRWEGAVAVTMPNRDLDRLVIQMNPPFQVDAMMEGAQPRASVRMMRLFGPRTIGLATRADRDGRVRFEAVYPGRYRMEEIGPAPPGYYLKSILLGTTDVTGREFDLTPSPPPMRFVWAKDAPRVSGTVENAPRAWIAIIETKPGGAVHFSLADSDGRFTVNGVGPGSWHAFAFDTIGPLNTDTVRHLVFGRGLARTAEVYHLREGETAHLKLRLSSWFE
jgi:hypothetical protein